MKKLFIAVLALGLLISCKDKKDGDDKKTENREKDDYQKKDDDKKSEDNDDKTADFKGDDNQVKDDNGKDNDNDNTTNFGTTNGWPQSERDGFVTSCVREAVKGGTSRPVAQRYCDCMLEKVEAMYPDINEAAKLNNKDLENIIAKYRDGCLK